MQLMKFYTQQKTKKSLNYMKNAVLIDNNLV